ncbi:MAG: type II toxin-antitoxin system VapC family toxin [Deltaproteobacteria bacterium]|nr:type II toxin-antitoxin system VapC family toxin [Deltaproteobacteria bacterium]
MNLLLDTHAFLWWITDAPKLSKTARELMGNGQNILYWSAASSWEVSIKYALGRLPLPEIPEIFLPSELSQNRIESLPVIDAHAFRAGHLPRYHRDPFDRMLIAQAQVESLALLSNDKKLGLYDVDVRW